MRRKFIAGNWKMNLDRASALALAQEVARRAAGKDGVDLAVFPPSVYIDAVRQAIAGSCLAWGAQNVYYEPNGAFTGEISVAMLADLGCRYAILGHSERRHILGETDEQVNKKVHAVLKGGILPVVCLGETLAERESGQTLKVIERQVSGSLAGLTAEQMSTVVIAYEPVWAIGTGRTATPDQAEEAHLLIREWIAGRYGGERAAETAILYGGSVTPKNIADLMREPDINGALVGGASLDIGSFVQLVGYSSIPEV